MVGLGDAAKKKPREPFGALDALTRGIIQDELIKIWSETQQTVFMITHDVDEAILLSDSILLMSNGPGACIAESVTVNIPRPRERAKVIEDQGYYKIRNHLVNFLVNRSGDFKCDNRPSQTHEVDPTDTALTKSPLLPADTSSTLTGKGKTTTNATMAMAS